MQLAADHRHGHSAPTGRTAVRGKHVTQRGGQFVDVGGRVRPGQIDVDNEVLRLGSGDCVEGVQRCRQPLTICHSRYQMQLPSGQFVTAGDELVTRSFEGLDVFERTDFVVLTRDDLKQCAGIGNALRQKIDQELWLRRCDKGVDACRVVRRVGIIGEVLHAFPHAVVDLLACVADLGLVEQAEPQVTRDIADNRVAHLCRNDQPVQYLAHRTGRSRRDIVGGEPAPKQRSDHRDLVLHPLQRQEQPVDRFFQLRSGLERVDVVIAQRASELGAKRRWQPLHLGVERMQEGMEVLARTMDGLVGFLFFVQSGTVAGNLADVGERVQQSEFGLDEFGVVEGLAATKGVVLGKQDACAVGAHVVPGDQGAEFAEPGEGLGARVRVLLPWLGTELNSRQGFNRGSFTGLVEAQQRGARIDLAVDRSEHLTNPSRGRCAQSGFHLHALQDHQRGTGLDLVAHRHRHSDNHRRRRGPDQAGFVLADAMTYPVYFDEEPGGARGRDDREAVVAKGESTLEFAEPFDLDDEFAAVSNDSVAARTNLSDRERVGLALVVEFYGSGRSRGRHEVDHHVPRPGNRHVRGFLRLRMRPPRRRSARCRPSA